MKKLLPLLWLPAIALSVFFSGCIKDKVSKTYTLMRPVYESKAVVYANIKSGPVHELQTPGKIFIRGNYLFINEIDKGIHIYDNSNPTSPRAVSFISIPGNVDVAVADHYLYADMYGDMVTVDIQDPLNAKLVDTSLNIFPDRSYSSGWSYDNDKIIVDWIYFDTTVTETGNNRWYDCMNCDFLAVPAAYTSGGGKANYVPGLAGSMARFVVVKDYLYAVSTSHLLSFNIDNPAKPDRKADTYVGWAIETIYPFQNRLFMGSSNGMFIYNIDDPAVPVAEGSFSHARACDPVVTDGDYAFVTLRSNDRCAGNANQLDILDVSNMMQPRQVKTYPLTNPQGLGKDGNLLFICDGQDGVKIFDVTDALNLKIVNQIKNIDAFDLIPWSNRLIVSAKGGLYQYDYSDVHDIKLLSNIRISNK